MKNYKAKKQTESKIYLIKNSSDSIDNLIKNLESSSESYVLFMKDANFGLTNPKVLSEYLDKAIRILNRNDHQGIIPSFKKDWWQSTPPTPFLLCKKEMAIYLLATIPKGKGYYFDAVIYNAEKLSNYVGTLSCPLPYIIDKQKRKRNFNLKNRINWYISLPLREKKNTIASKFISESSIYRLLFVAVAVLGLLSMLIMSIDAGISSDEFRYIGQAEKVYNYYTSFGEDKSATANTGMDAQHYNSQSFDVILYALQKSLGMENNFMIRHLFNSFFGWIALLFTALITIRIAGFRAGLIAFSLLFISPRFLGHSLNNHRDIIIASVFVFTVYYMLPYFEKIKNQDRRWIILITIGLISAFSLRFSSWIILFFYFSLFSVLALLKSINFKTLLSLKTRKLGLNMFVISSLIFLLSFNIGILTWPFGLESPIKNSLEVFNASSNLGVSINLLFEGDIIMSNTIPWYYVVKFIGITTPCIIFIGVLLFIGSLKNIKNKKSRFELFLISLAFLIPIAISIIYLKNDYGGWRHFIFAYPFLVILSAIGLNSFIKSVLTHSKKLMPFLLITLFALSIHPIIFIIKNHPYQYVYFNEILGGVKNAHGYYSVDYGANSLKEGSKWLGENIFEKHSGKEKLTLVTNDTKAVNYYLKNYKDKVDVKYSRYYAKNRTDWDYAIFYCDYIDPFQLQNNLWPPTGTIHTIEVDNQAIAAIMKRPSKDSYQGYEAMKKGDFTTAISLFENYVQKVDTTSEEIFSYLASSYLSRKDFARALKYADKSISLHPSNNVNSLNVKGRLHVTNRKYTEAIDVFDEIIKRSPKYTDAYYLKAYSLTQLNEINKAILTLTTVININPKFKIAYELMADIYNKSGNQHKAKEVLKIMKKNISK